MGKKAKKVPGVMGEDIPASFYVGPEVADLEPSPDFAPFRKGTKIYAIAIRNEENPYWHGVYALEPKKKKADDQEQPWKVTQVCETPFEIVSLVFDHDTGNQAVEIGYLPSGLVDWVYEVWDKADLVNSKIDSFVWRQLVRSGVNVSSRQLSLLQEYIRNASDFLPSCGLIPRRKGAKRTGWVGGEYVAPGWSTKKAPLYIGGGVNASTGAWERAGDKETFFSIFKSLVETNPYFELLAGFFLSGFLLAKLEGAENFILCVLGDSTLGKTFAIKLCLAMRGRPGAFGTFNATSGALQAMMAQNNDSCMVIDETGTSTMTTAQRGNFIYDVSNGRDRGRLQRSGDGRFDPSEIKPYQYSVIITGEESLLTNPSADGQRVRYTEIIFDREHKILWPGITSGQQADNYLQVFEKNHGFIAPLAVELVQKTPDRYRTVWAESLRRLNEIEENPKARRKHKLLASAMAGACLLDDVLGKKWDQEKTLQVALKLAPETNMDLVDEANENEQYLDAMSGSLARFRDHFYLQKNDEEIAPRRSPVYGKYVVEDEVHSLILDCKAAPEWAEKAGVDIKRFLSWAKNQGYLKTYSCEGGKKQRRAILHNVGGVSINTYILNFPAPVTDGSGGSDDTPF